MQVCSGGDCEAISTQKAGCATLLRNNLLTCNYCLRVSMLAGGRPSLIGSWLVDSYASLCERRLCNTAAQRRRLFTRDAYIPESPPRLDTVQYCDISAFLLGWHQPTNQSGRA